MPTDPAALDRARGCLLGLACGDALGGPVEFRARDEIARAYPGGLRDFVGGGWLDLAPGEVTDDTQLARCLARALTADGLDLDRLVDEFLAWFRSGPKDVGKTTRAALAALAAGEAWDRAGEAALRALPPGKGATNGAVMRCAPVAIRFRHDSAALVRASLDSARITHAEPRAAWAAVAVNQAIAHLLGSGAKEAAPAAAAAGVPEPQVRAAVLGAANLRSDEVRGTGFVLDTLAASFWALATTDSAEGAIVAAVALGDDADTTGAVAGALAGAHYGAAALPARWVDRLQPRAELEAHAQRLLDLADGRRQTADGRRQTADGRRQ